MSLYPRSFRGVLWISEAFTSTYIHTKPHVVYFELLKVRHCGQWPMMQMVFFDILPIDLLVITYIIIIIIFKLLGIVQSSVLNSNQFLIAMSVVEIKVVREIAHVFYLSIFQGQIKNSLQASIYFNISSFSDILITTVKIIFSDFNLLFLIPKTTPTSSPCS